MSGTLVGVVDSLINGANTPLFSDRYKNAFSNLYKFMQRHVTVGNATLHASNFGSGGTGFDYHDGANPSGENAWAVYKFLASASSVRTTDFYVLIQWAYSSTFGASPGNPGAGDIADMIGVAMAYREDNGDPWNGTTNANGADTKGTPVWTGTGLHVFPERNESGSWSTNKEGLKYVLLPDTGGGADYRTFFVGDADGLLILGDADDDNDLDSLQTMYLGVYTPRADLTIPNPYVLISDITGSGTRIDQHGGVMSVTESLGVTGVQLYFPTSSTFGSPETLDGGSKWLDFPYYLIRPQSEDAVEYGLLGHLPTDLVRLNYGVPNYTVNAAFTRAIMGETNSNGSTKLSIAYGGGAAPGIAGDRIGVVF